MLFALNEGEARTPRKPSKNTIFLWYDDDAEDDARFYAKTFPDSAVGAIQRAPGDYPAVDGTRRRAHAEAEH